MCIAGAGLYPTSILAGHCCAMASSLVRDASDGWRSQPFHIQGGSYAGAVSASERAGLLQGSRPPPARTACERAVAVLGLVGAARALEIRIETALRFGIEIATAQAGGVVRWTRRSRASKGRAGTGFHLQWSGRVVLEPGW